MADAEEFLIIKGKRIVLPDCISSGSIIVRNEKIVGIERSLDTTFLTSKAKVKKAIFYTSRYPNGAYTVSIASPVFSSKKKKRNQRKRFSCKLDQISGRKRFCVIRNHFLYSVLWLWLRDRRTFHFAGIKFTHKTDLMGCWKILVSKWRSRGYILLYPTLKGKFRETMVRGPWWHKACKQIEQYSRRCESHPCIVKHPLELWGSVLRSCSNVLTINMYRFKCWFCRNGSFVSLLV